MLEQTPVPLSVKKPQSSEAIELEDIQKEDQYLLPPGQTAPVSSIITEGEADFSLEWINGEPDPVHRSTGMQIPAGAINLSQNHTVLMAEEDWKDSLLSKLLSVSESITRNPRMEKILRYYLAAVFILGFGGGIAWLMAGKPLAEAAQVTISIFVISCPCALGVALPLADELTSGRMRTLGVFIRRPAFWSRIREIKTIFFDKTGTLTMDLPELTDKEALEKLDTHTTAILARLCASSRHPLSRSIMRALGLRGQNLLKTTPLPLPQEIPGLGTFLKDESQQIWSLGKSGWDATDTIARVKATRPGCELRCNNSLIAYFEFQEALRPEAAETLQSLSAYHPHILSGDHNDRVTHIAQVLKVDSQNVHAGLSPEQKAELVAQIDPHHSLFLGDGANDSLAFDAAAMTGAVAGRGLLESKADFYFLSSGLHFLPVMFSLAQNHARATRAVFSFSVLYNLTAVGICLAGWMNPLLAAVLMPISSIASLSIVKIMIPSK